MRNVEIKARYRKTKQTERLPKKIGARFEKVEVQKDTYFNVDRGRLKIRERDSEAPQLIQYFREDEDRPRPSYYEIVHLKDVDRIRETLEREHGVRGIVRKRREIWVWENVRIHFDVVEELGEFLEFEAVLETNDGVESGEKRVRELVERFGIGEEDLVGLSYIDLLTS